MLKDSITVKLIQTSSGDLAHDYVRQIAQWERSQYTSEYAHAAEWVRQKAVEFGFAFAWWCGKPECEATIKEETRATMRNIPLDQPVGEGRCIHCGAPAREKAYFARAY